MKIPLFDVDGTLVRGHASIHSDSYDAIFEQVFQIKASYKEINYRGMIDPQIILEVAKFHSITQKEVEEKLPQVYRVMREYLSQHRQEADYEILPGVEKLFQTLKKRHIPIGLLTGNIAEASEMKLAPSGLWDYVDFGAYGSDAISFMRVELVAIAQQKASKILGKPVTLSELTIIGDTPKDIQCARDGGITSIGVATGIYSMEELQNAGADLVVSSLKETKPILSFLQHRVNSIKTSDS